VPDVRVTLVNQFFPPDLAPTAHLADSLARHRTRLGDRVTVVTGRGGYTGRRDLDDAPAGDHRGGTAEHGGPRVIRLWTPSLGKASAGRRLTDYLVFLAGALVRLVTLPRQDVVIAMTTPPYVVVAAVAHKVFHRGRPRVVLWSMDVYPEAVERFGPVRPGGVVSKLLRVLNRWVRRHVDEVVVLDEAMASLVRSQAAAEGRPDADDAGPPITIVANWERMDHYPTDSGPPRWSGYDVAALRGRFVVLYMGNLGLGHTPGTVADAAERLGADSGVTFLFVGGGARWAELETAVSARHLDHVVLRPYVSKDETPGVLAGAACSLILLDDEALGVMSPSKLHASLAMGRPIVYVGPAGSNVDDAIERFGCGISVRSGDVDGLVDAVCRLRDDHDWTAQLSKQARLAFESAYADTVALPRFDAVIDGGISTNG
jgi:glycosyltransferase involved in cell wall biosynthesis